MNNEKTLREKAVHYWGQLTINERRELTKRYFPNADKEHGFNRAYLYIGNVAVEKIYLFEHPQQANSVVSIEDAAVNYAERQTKHFLPANDKVAFKEGAKFRDEQYNSLLNSYREIIGLLDIFRAYACDHDNFNLRDNALKSEIAIEKANNILKQFNQ